MLETEKVNEATRHIGEMDTIDAVKLMQEENLNAAKAVGTVVNEVAKVIDQVSSRMKQGGRLFYVGCGTSGRIGVLDASECPPTFGVSPELVVGIIAGGERAIRHAVEGAEDSIEMGAEAIIENKITEKDSVIGISAAGGANFVIGALNQAKKLGAFTASVSSNKVSKIGDIADVAITTPTGAEVIAGSTRMKAGTAQKMVLNMISTGVMIRMGYVYENRMINLRPSNVKLKNRMIVIVQDILNVPFEEAEQLLEKGEWVIRKAIEIKKDGK